VAAAAALDADGMVLAAERLLENEPERAALAERAARLELADGGRSRDSGARRSRPNRRSTQRPGNELRAQRESMSNVVLLGYDLEQPSSGIAAYAHRHARSGRVAGAGGALPQRPYGLRTWERRSLLRGADVVVLHQIKLSAIEAHLFASFSRRRIFDVDDAITCASRGDSVRRRTTRPGQKEFARPAAGWMWSPPATMSWPASRASPLGRHDSPPRSIPPPITRRRPHRRSATVVWIGSPEDLVYLEMIRPALARLTTGIDAQDAGHLLSVSGLVRVNIERIAWSSATEAKELAGEHIGRDAADR